MDNSFGKLTYLYNVADYEFSYLHLNGLSATYDAESLLALDAILQASKLALFRPIVKSGHENDNDDGNEDGHALDPGRVILFLFV